MNTHYRTSVYKLASPGSFCQVHYFHRVVYNLFQFSEFCNKLSFSFSYYKHFIEPLGLGIGILVVGIFQMAGGKKENERCYPLIYYYKWLQLTSYYQ